MTYRTILLPVLALLITACGGGNTGTEVVTTVASNTTPVANAGTDQSVTTGDTVTLSAAASTDSDGDALSYTWSLTTVPTGSSASLTSSTLVTSGFTPDTDGVYVASLTVNDGTVDSIAATVTITSSTVSTGTADFYAPAPISQALQQSRSVAWSELAEVPTDLMRFSMGEAGSTDLFLVEDEATSVNQSLAIASGLTARSAAIDDVLLGTMFQFRELDDGTFQIVSTKHSNYALDVGDPGVSDTLILADVRSGDINPNSAGYLSFSLNGASPLVLSASGRMVYDSTTSSFVNDTSWIAKNVTLINSELVLTTDTGTSMTLYSPPINLDVPFDFNPDAIERVGNTEVTLSTVDDLLFDTPNRLADVYKPQVAVAGPDSTTTAAAVAMIAQIEDDLALEGAQTRYPAEFYLAFRAGMLSRTLQSAESTDGVLGQYTVPYVYFTNEADSAGVHHPFMIIATYGLPDTLALLWDVAKPPGDGLTQDYTTQSVTRHHHRANFMTKIPMRDYGEVESLTENIMNADLATDVGETNFTHHNRASVSATGMAIDGVIVYPTLNNSLHVSQTDAELSAHGMHSGRGLGVHYHADAHSATGEGLNLYNASDYVGHTHPPIVSIGFDGIAGYGVYAANDTISDGATIALDEFGGHEHGAYAYHYHSFTEEEVTELGGGPNPTGNVDFTAHKLPPLGAWAGRINSIPEFWNDRAPEYTGGNSVYLGTQ